MLRLKDNTLKMCFKKLVWVNNHLTFIMWYYRLLTFMRNTCVFLWEQWVPQGLEISSAMPCIQHQILLNHIYMRIHHHFHFWTLNHQGARIELLAAIPLEYGYNFTTKRSEFPIEIGPLSILVICPLKVENSKIPNKKRR